MASEHPLTCYSNGETIGYLPIALFTFLKGEKIEKTGKTESYVTFILNRTKPRLHRRRTDFPICPWSGPAGGGTACLSPHP